ncbi:TraB/GumN family protein [Altererythrobacter lutimaris]|uniref:TraB/GumN family protein n=1 Tax=Altererythrobacter lutimaris TaxID=2743979 RepID=A0A850H3L9_9SPHN|nr:TraB/GumN family protein [Altererythrobacter lutimaris]NVE93757.1 TraB/GumN family protein [Altererythrobacter lutimaris]
MLRTLLTGFAALCVAACSDTPDSPSQGSAPSPLLYEVTSPDGATEGWLFGTIHALPDGTEWRTDVLQDTIENSDYLVVEIAGLDNQRAMVDTFMALSRTPDQPDIGTRVEQSERPLLFDLIDRAGYSAHDFASVETWAAALMLAQVNATGDPANGVDRALLKDFQGRDIREFEGADVQLGIFDQLAEKDQRDLLSGVLEESQSDDPTRLRNAWLAGDETILIEATNTGIMTDPELRAAILTDRNDEWMRQLVPLLQGDPKPFVAVGAAHLVGPEGLPAQLEALGYTVERIQ